MTALDTFSLDGRVALIVGGGGAIGSALAEGLASAGAKVAVSGRTRETLDDAVSRITAAGSEGLAIAGDATDEAGCGCRVRAAPNGSWLAFLLCLGALGATSRRRFDSKHSAASTSPSTSTFTNARTSSSASPARRA